MQPVCTTVSTSCHADRGLVGHHWCVNMGDDYGKTRLYSSICSKTTALPQCGRRGDESAGKRSHRNRSSSPEQLSQLLLPRPQKRWRPATYSRSQTPELGPDEKVVQDDHFETDPLVNMPKGLVHVAGSERRVLSHTGCPPLRTIFEIRIQRGGISIQVPAVWAVPGSLHCMDTALSPLRQMGIRILNYLDDWLILAQSQAVLTSHKTLPLSHLDCLGLGVNFAKSILSPSQRVSFLGKVIDTVQMKTTVSAERATTIQRHAASFKEGTACPLKAFQKMLVREHRHKLILIAPLWWNQPWVLELWALHVWPLDGSLSSYQSVS